MIADHLVFQAVGLKAHGFFFGVFMTVLPFTHYQNIHPLLNMEDIRLWIMAVLPGEHLERFFETAFN